MVRRTFWKNGLRSVRSSLSRFLAIFAIVALGSGFLAGLLATTPDMRNSAGEYYRETNLYDLRIAGTLGLEENDAQALSSVSGVKAVMPAHSIDREVSLSTGDTLAARIHGVHCFGRENAEDMNRSLLVEGRWPEAENECVVERDFSLSEGGLGLGSCITVVQNDEDADEPALTVTEYTVTGIVTSGYYISLVQRGSTTVGNGTIGCIVYISDSCFALDYYTDLYVSVEGASELKAYSTEYDDAVSSVQQSVKALAEDQRHVRADSLRSEGQKELDDAQKELDEQSAKGQKELDDALKELQDGETKYADGLQEAESGRAKLEDARRELQQGEHDLTQALSTLQSGEEDYAQGQKDYESGLADYQAALSAFQTGQEEYQSGLLEYEENEAKLAEAYTQLQEGRKQLADAKETLAEGEEQLQSGEQQLEAARTQLEESQAQLDAAFSSLAQQEAQLSAAFEMGLLSEEEYQASLAQLNIARQTLNANQAQLDAGFSQLEDSEKELTRASKKLAQGREDYNSASQELSEAESQYQQGLRQLTEGKAQLDSAASELENGKVQLEEAEAQLSDASISLSDARKTLDDGWAEYNSGKETLQQGWRDYQSGIEELDSADETLADSRKTLDDGWAEYESGKQEYEEKIADARLQLRDAQEQLAQIDDPEWYVLTRGESNEGYIYYESDTEKVQSIARVFPVFFFLVAALVASTTMSRMIDEDRGNIGTLMALGYSSRAIGMKYICYALSASLLGCGFGLSVGLYLFPRVICNAYKMMYQMPGLVPASHLSYILLSAGLILLAILLATLSALRTSLQSCAASLMRPKTPPAGKRILLERVQFVWKRMRFSHKVTARNLFRYKKRFFMTILGITGCTALLLTGFGLRDSISDIVDLQFGELMQYNLTVHLEHPEDVSDNRRLAAVLADDSCIQAFLPVHSETGLGLTENAEVDLTIVVPQDDAALSDFVLFRQRKSHEAVSFSQEGAILSEKAALLLGVQVGDSITLQNQDGKQAEVPIAGVCENYVYGYLYLPHSLYEAVFEESCTYDTLYVKSQTADGDARDVLAQRLLASGSVTGVSFSDSVRESFSDMLKSIDSIVVLLIVAAAALAFVVLYNLTNINICEREKELATIKVLGFHPGEVSAYIYRETVCLSLMGTALGLFFGIFFHQFVVQTAEVDAVMFGRDISPVSFVCSAALTLLFTLLVNLVMARKLKRIDMVESLKAPE